MSNKERSSLTKYYNTKGKYFNNVDYRLRVMIQNTKTQSKLKDHNFNLNVKHLHQL